MYAYASSNRCVWQIVSRLLVFLQVHCDAQLPQQFAIPCACLAQTQHIRLDSQHMRQEEDQKQENKPAESYM